MRLVLRDLRAIAAFYPSKLAELGDPEDDWLGWQRIISDFPHQWAELVRGFIVHESIADAGSAPIGGNANATPAAGLSICDICQVGFASELSLKVHRRFKHKQSSAFKDYVGADAACPVCKMVFSTRLRCIAHLSVTRKRSPKMLCSELLASSGATRLPQDEADRLDELDRKARRLAQQAGHSVPLTVGMPKKYAALPHNLQPVRRRIRCKTSGPSLAQAFPKRDLHEVYSFPHIPSCKRRRLHTKTPGATVQHLYPSP
jgi:hypothetical protein